jgi:hypothetical protein
MSGIEQLLNDCYENIDDTQCLMMVGTTTDGETLVGMSGKADSEDIKAMIGALVNLVMDLYDGPEEGEMLQ